MVYEFIGSTTSIRIESFGAMTTFCFHTPNRDISPMFTKNWNFPDDPFLDHLQGDFFATPFGSNPIDFSAFPAKWKNLWKTSDSSFDLPHGYGAHHNWHLKETLPNGLLMEISYPHEIIHRVERKVTTEHFCVSFEDTIEIAKDGKLPMGIHPIFRLSGQPGQTALTLPKCQMIHTYPISLDHSSIFAADQIVSAENIPLKEGGTANILRLPLIQSAEELLLLCNVKKPEFFLQNYVEHYLIKMTWDNRYLKNCLLWLSNRGRQFAPWNGQTLCLGVEPITAAFDLGKKISFGENPLKAEGVETEIAVRKGERIILQHKIELVAFDQS